MTKLAEKQTDYLILLVGKNPLPNAVAGCLLAKPGGTLLLVHSLSTSTEAEYLAKWFRERSDANKINFLEINESDPVSIFQKIQQNLDRCLLKEGEGQSQKATLGLNYTGGTKAMAVHTYRAVEAWSENNGVKPVFSYLDARTLKMVFEPNDPAKGGYCGAVSLGTAVKMELEKDLMVLHGWSLNQKNMPQKNIPQKEPVFFASASVLAKMYADSSDGDLWRDIKNDLDRVPKAVLKLDQDVDQKNVVKWDDKQGERFQELWSEFIETLVKESGYNFSRVREFDKDHREEWLEELRAEFDEFSKLCKKDTESRKRLIEQDGFYKGWFKDKWLEQYVHGILDALAGELQFNECLSNIKPYNEKKEDIKFEVDAIAIRGYQLFGFSCSTTKKKKELKLKLFEAYIRACQLGGDEARVALVCCSDDPEVIKKELEQEVALDDANSSGRIQVFGRRQLVNLKDHIRSWVLDLS